MKVYFIQEKIDNNTWFDVYTSDLCILKKMIFHLKIRNPHKKYRIIKVFV